MYNTTAFVGLAFGDEGKGKVVDYCAQAYDVVVRYAGGPNAGHTLKVDGQKVVLRLIPSGILHPHTECIMAHGMVIDPNVFHEEVTKLEEMGVKLDGRLFLSERAHVIMPEHIEKDIAKNGKLGTTKKGIGPTYEAKVRRDGVRVLDLKHLTTYTLDYLSGNNPGVGKDGKLIFSNEVLKTLTRFTHEWIPKIINGHIRDGKSVMFEGAQGTLLDIDCGTYPYVTSSNAIAGGACTGSGVGPTAITSCIGITKAYVTRVGEGPFPSEVNGEISKHLQTVGNEFGSVTGRPRKVGWLDLPLLKYAIEVNDVSMLAVTKLDVLTGLDEIKVATHHLWDDAVFDYPVLDDLPRDICEQDYKKLPGWTEDITNVKSFDELPVNAQNYINYLAKELDVPICLVSVGPGRDQTINMMEEAYDSFYAKRFGWVGAGITDAVNTFVETINQDIPQP
jgi:adenylosuccinate synthase